MTLLEILRDIHKDMQSPANWNQCGVCRQVADRLASRRMRAKLWELNAEYANTLGHGPEDIAYPVLGGVTAYFRASKQTTAQDAARAMWSKDTVYGEARWHYLEWCIYQLEKEQNNGY